MESGALSYIIYTGALLDETLGDFRKLHRKAMNLSIPCLTSADTAEALAEMITSGYNALNTELVNIANMRKSHVRYRFTKMQDCGNDYIFIENFDGKVEAIESLCVTLCDRHTGIGADGIVLLEKSDKADALMRTYNKDQKTYEYTGNMYINAFLNYEAALHPDVEIATDIKIRADFGEMNQHLAVLLVNLFDARLRQMPEKGMIQLKMMEHEGILEIKLHSLGYAREEDSQEEMIIQSMLSKLDVVARTETKETTSILLRV